MKRFDPLSLTAAQLRAARALLNWSAADLADAAKIGVATIRRGELVDGPINARMKPENVVGLVETLQKAGIQFIAANGGGVGVRLRA